MPERPGVATQSPLLEVSDLTKHYGPVRALDGVGFSCAPGEVHALLGENGAGKSTLVKVLSGAHLPDRGSVRIDGAEVQLGTVRRAHASGIYCVFQELSLVPDWTVAENLMLRDRKLLGGYSPRSAVRRAQEILETSRLELDPSAPVRVLPLRQRQQLEIARALHAGPRVLILDEASSALGPQEVAWLLGEIRRLRERGSAIIYVSHRLGEIAEVADTGTVLRDGQVAGSFDRATYDEDALVTAMAGRPVSTLYPARPATPRDDVPCALEVDGLSGPRLHDICLRLAPGEILGVGGLDGHGQAELLNALYGIVPANARTWRVNGRTVRRLTPGRAVRLGIGYVPEERKTQGLALDLSVGENLVVPWLRPLGPGGRIAQRRQRDWIARILNDLSVKSRGADDAARNLSGGNQQKVVFGRWLDRSRAVLLLHDPTRGVDVRSKHELYRVITEIAARGTAILWLSTEIEELVHLCHRVVVLYRGAVSDELEGERLTMENVVGAAIGRAR